MRASLHEPSPSCSSSCAKSDRPFRIDGHGHNAEAEINAAIGALWHLADPFDSFKLRHLERDLFAVQRITAKRRRQLHRARAAGEELTMIWPNWEAGFGDPYMWTVIPLGYTMAQGQLPNSTLAISGALYPRLYEREIFSNTCVCTSRCVGLAKSARLSVTAATSSEVQTTVKTIAIAKVHLLCITPSTRFRAVPPHATPASPSVCRRTSRASTRGSA